MEAPSILVVDDDHEIVNLIAESLEEEGYVVIKAYNGAEALELLSNSKVSLMILDIMMPDVDGLEVCRRVRSNVVTPIIILSAKDREKDKVIGLELGADDYMTKPFSVNELVARVNAHIRREKRNTSLQKNALNTYKFGNLEINKDSYEVLLNNRKVELSTREFQILVYLAENRNRVLSREQIYEAIWGNSELGDVNTVTVHIKNLRCKLDTNNEFIKTVWGIGYKFIGGVS